VTTGSNLDVNVTLINVSPKSKTVINFVDTLINVINVTNTTTYQDAKTSTIFFSSNPLHYSLSSLAGIHYG